MDGRVVECNNNLYSKVKPWISNYEKDKTWDYLTGCITGSVIKDYSFTDDIFLLEIVNSMNKYLKIEFVKNDIRLPRKSGRKRNAFKKGIISDYILFQHHNGKLVV